LFLFDSKKLAFSPAASPDFSFFGSPLSTLYVNLCFSISNRSSYHSILMNVLKGIILLLRLFSCFSYSDNGPRSFPAFFVFSFFFDTQFCLCFLFFVSIPTLSFLSLLVTLLVCEFQPTISGFPFFNPLSLCGSNFLVTLGPPHLFGGICLMLELSDPEDSLFLPV